MVRWPAYILLNVILAVAVCEAAPTNSLFNPANYPLAGATLNVSSGTISIDTKDGTTPPVLIVGSVTNTGMIVTNQSGNVVMALFNYGRVTFASGVNVSVTGNLGLVLASMKSIDIAGTVSLNGNAGSTDIAANQPQGGAGGAGAEAGLRGVSYTGAPPTSVRGNGGNGGRWYDAGGSGVGYGGGVGLGSYDSRRTGGGAGHGGTGGTGFASLGSGSAGGVSYGDTALTDLRGGSGGGGGFQSATKDSESASGGGGGGGALELVALAGITLTGTINANGGAGGGALTGAGGGSGGAIILAAPYISAAGGTITTAGGSGGDGASDWGFAGGGGGGGRVALYYRDTLVAPSYSVAGGLGGLNGPGFGGSRAGAGASGTYTEFQTFPFKNVLRGTVISVK